MYTDTTYSFVFLDTSYLQAAVTNHHRMSLSQVVCPGFTNTIIAATGFHRLRKGPRFSILLHPAFLTFFILMNIDYALPAWRFTFIFVRLRSDLALTVSPLRQARYPGIGIQLYVYETEGIWLMRLFCQISLNAGYENAVACLVHWSLGQPRVTRHSPLRSQARSSRTLVFRHYLAQHALLPVVPVPAIYLSRTIGSPCLDKC